MFMQQFYNMLTNDSYVAFNIFSSNLDGNIL